MPQRTVAERLGREATKNARSGRAASVFLFRSDRGGRNPRKPTAREESPEGCRRESRCGGCERKNRVGIRMLDLDKVVLYSLSNLVHAQRTEVDKMQQVNIFQAKQTFSALIEAVESGQEDEIIIARNNKPVARILPYQAHKPVIIGIAKGQFEVPDDIDRHNDEIAEMFEAL